jgi:hypothetical protein
MIGRCACPSSNTSPHALGRSPYGAPLRYPARVKGNTAIPYLGLVFTHARKKLIQHVYNY